MRPTAALFALLILPAMAWAQATPTPPHKAAATPAPAPAAAAAKAPDAKAAAAKPGAPKPGAPKAGTAKPAAPHSARPHPAAPRPPAHSAPAPAAAPAAAPEPEKPAEPTKGTNTGMPLPRFAALRSEEVNLRTGPGVRYPIEWVYKRRDLPVQIQREFEVWRLIQDQEGIKGWVHQATLAPRRTAVVIGAEHVLRRSADDAAAPVARLKPGVILRLRSCEATSGWCQAQIGDYRGWVKRSEIWGTFPNEVVQ